MCISFSISGVTVSIQWVSSCCRSFAPDSELPRLPIRQVLIVCSRRYAPSIISGPEKLGHIISDFPGNLSVLNHRDLPINCIESVRQLCPHHCHQPARQIVGPQITCRCAEHNNINLSQHRSHEPCTNLQGLKFTDA